LAQLGAQVVAFDPDRSLIRNARRNLPRRYARKVEYYAGSARRLKHPAESFDLVVFAWSL
jgi:ubiquinone/menaquinone biosynthesis C-methylase UbiE